MGRIDKIVISPDNTKAIDFINKLQNRKKEIESSILKRLLEQNIGQQVKKKSGKPFKSTFKINTIKEVINHPKREGLAYTFEEDDSYVSVDMCELIE